MKAVLMACFLSSAVLAEHAFQVGVLGSATFIQGKVNNPQGEIHGFFHEGTTKGDIGLSVGYNYFHKCYLLGIESRLFIGDNRQTKIFKVGPNLYEASFARGLLSGEILAKAGINIAKNTYAYAGVGGRLTRFKSEVTVNYEGDKTSTTKTNLSPLIEMGIDGKFHETSWGWRVSGGWSPLKWRTIKTPDTVINPGDFKMKFDEKIIRVGLTYSFPVRAS